MLPARARASLLPGSALAAHCLMSPLILTCPLTAPMGPTQCRRAPPFNSLPLLGRPPRQIPQHKHRLGAPQHGRIQFPHRPIHRRSACLIAASRNSGWRLR